MQFHFFPETKVAFLYIQLFFLKPENIQFAFIEYYYSSWNQVFSLTFFTDS